MRFQWSFNPNMVWFQAKVCVSKLSRLTPFNPNMVWFQGCLDNWGCQYCCLSIPTWSDFKFKSNERNLWIPFFQSQHGLISSYLRSDNQSRRGDLSIPTWSDFKEVIEVNYKKTCPFQSQHGLISRCLLSISIIIMYWTFNPNMVWFQDPHSNVIGTYNVPFNPNMVWFQACTAKILCLYSPSFNPNMVWFQGTKLFYRRLVTIVLSIPTWSDFKSLKTNLQNSFIRLSIPTWSDFKLIPMQPGRFQTFRFQSQHGLISRRPLFPLFTHYYINLSPVFTPLVVDLWLPPSFIKIHDFCEISHNPQKSEASFYLLSNIRHKRK